MKKRLKNAEAVWNGKSLALTCNWRPSFFPILLELQLYWWNFCIAFTTLDHVHFTQIVLVFGFENMKWSPKWNHPFSFYHCLLFTSHPLLTPVTVVFGSTLEQIQKKKKLNWWPPYCDVGDVECRRQPTNMTSNDNFFLIRTENTRNAFHTP